MKKLSLILAACALILGSCAKNESGSKGQEGAPGTIVFEVSTDAALAARGGTLLGADSTKDVSSVVIYGFVETPAESGTYLYDDQAIALDNTWTLGDLSTTATITGFATAAANYKFLAVGYTDDTSFATLNLQDGTTDFDDVAATLNGDAGDAVPIYSGPSAVTALAPNSFARIPITIKRAVSGILVYVKDIPVDVDGETPAFLRLTAAPGDGDGTDSQLCTEVNLATQAGQMSGVVAVEGLVLIEIPLDDNDGTVFTSNYPQPNSPTTDGQVVALPFSQLGGTYVLPNANDGTGVKLMLGLYDASDVMIQEWPLNGGASIVLAPNVLYSLGTKRLSTSINGYDDTPDDTPNDGTDPKDDDNALDLETDQIILVEVESGWGDISNLLLP